MNSRRLLDIATGVAMGRLRFKQPFRLGAAAIRRDGVIVVSFNSQATEPEWTAHAESRLARKLTPDSVVAVARVHANGQWAMSRPCISCQTCLRRVGVKRVYYTIQPEEYGIMLL